VERLRDDQPAPGRRFARLIGVEVDRHDAHVDPAGPHPGQELLGDDAFVAHVVLAHDRVQEVPVRVEDSGLVV